MTEQINNHFANLNEITAVDKNYHMILKLQCKCIEGSDICEVPA